MLFQLSSIWSSRVCFLNAVVLVTALLISIFKATTGLSSSSHCYKSIFSFGDSFADTGTFYYDTPKTPHFCINPPYGKTYFHHPTGRYSDGRLIIDFLAQHLGLPLLKPYMGIKNGQIQEWNILEGVNFAAGGATALDFSFFVEKGICNVGTNYSLKVQLDWFKELLPSICNSSSGFTETVLNACCGDLKNFCGSPGLTACDDPSQYISWDGIHFTEAAYRWIAKGLINGQYTKPKIRISCDSEI